MYEQEFKCGFTDICVTLHLQSAAPCASPLAQRVCFRGKRKVIALINIEQIRLSDPPVCQFAEMDSPPIYFREGSRLKPRNMSLCGLSETQITSTRSVKYATADLHCFTFCIFIVDLLQSLATRTFYLSRPAIFRSIWEKNKPTETTFIQCMWMFKSCAKFKANWSRP